MKKIFTSILLFLAWNYTTYGQCTAGSAYGSATAPTISATLSGASCTSTPVINSATTCAYNGEYSTFTGLTIGETYQVGNCFTGSTDGGAVGSDITVRDGTSGTGTVLGFSSSTSGGTCVTFVATGTDVTVQVNDPGCVNSSNCNSIEIQCTSCPTGPLPITPSGPCNNNTTGLTSPSCTYADMVAGGSATSSGTGGSVICGTSLPATYPAQTTGGSCASGGGGTGTTYGCLGSQPNPSWFSFQSASAGSLCLDMGNSASLDIDFAVWGPVEDCDPVTSGYQNGSGGLGAPIDCDYSTAPGGQINVCATAANQTFIVLVTNFNGGATNISLSDCATPGTAGFACPPTIAPLPVHLSRFMAFPEGSANRLKWETSYENNAKQFRILRSADGVAFTKIGIVQAIGNSAEINKYEFVDKNPLLGKNYYKLEQWDIDNSIYHSGIVNVVREGAEGVNIYPNPFEDKIIMNMSVIRDLKVSIYVYDLSGRRVLAEEKTAFPGLNTFEIHSGELNKGIYTVQVVRNNEVLGIYKMRK